MTALQEPMIINARKPEHWNATPSPFLPTSIIINSNYVHLSRMSLHIISAWIFWPLISSTDMLAVWETVGESGFSKWTEEEKSRRVFSNLGQNCSCILHMFFLLLWRPLQRKMGKGPLRKVITTLRNAGEFWQKSNFHTNHATISFHLNSVLLR